MADCFPLDYGVFILLPIPVLQLRYVENNWAYYWRLRKRGWLPYFPCGAWFSLTFLGFSFLTSWGPSVFSPNSPFSLLYLLFVSLSDHRAHFHLLLERSNPRPWPGTTLRATLIYHSQAWALRKLATLIERYKQSRIFEAICSLL